MTNAVPKKMSIIIPVYNEERVIMQSVRTFIRTFESAGVQYELIVVNDGSTDGTSQKISELASLYPCVTAIEYPENQGKGYAIKEGMRRTAGDYMGFIDADLSIPPDSIVSSLAILEDGTDVVIASRAVHSRFRAQSPSRLRNFSSHVFNFLRRAIVGLRHISDTQCGFKIFRQPIAALILKKSVVHGFAFDVEALFIAVRNGFTVRELPVKLSYKKNNFGVFALAIQAYRMVRDLIHIRILALLGHYDT